jgi:phosphoglycolate phosphatase
MAGGTLLLDLDGTVLDSAPWYAARLSADLAERVDLANRMTAPNAGVNVAKLLKEAGYTTGRIRTACRGYGPPAIYPGALSALRTYTQTDWRIAIVTNLPAWLVTPLVESSELKDLIEHMETAKRGVPPKPRPNLLLRALAVLETLPSTATMLGDTTGDLKAATAAGTRFVWAGWGYGGVPPKGVAVAQSWEKLQL